MAFNKCVSLKKCSAFLLCTFKLMLDPLYDWVRAKRECNNLLRPFYLLKFCGCENLGYFQAYMTVLSSEAFFSTLAWVLAGLVGGRLESRCNLFLIKFRFNQDGVMIIII